jgi:hypothetical protein
MSRFVIALFFFLSLGFLTVKVTQPMQNKAATVVEEKTWTEWALTDFNKQKDNPAPVAIIGSSLVLTPVNLADAYFHNSIVNGATHHTSDLLASYMSTPEHTVQNFNFAIPGLMPSDAYLMTKLLMGGQKHPKLLIYGVGPRDFVDNLLAGPASTDPYRCLAKDLPDEDTDGALALYKGKDWQSHFDYFLSQYFPLYSQRNNIITYCTKQGQNFYTKASDSVGWDESAPNKLTIADVHNLLPSYNPMAIGINQCLFQPKVQLEPDRFAKNLNEYRMRYGKINWETFTCQANFFVDTIKAARDNDITVLIVAMPITSVNRALLPDYIFETYKNNLRVLSKSFGANFFDLDDMHCFNDNDFGDTVHLSTSGSTKMIKLIADYIAQHNLYNADDNSQIHLAETGVKL